MMSESFFRQLVVRLENLESGSGVQSGGVLYKRRNEICRALYPRTCIGHAVCHDVLLDLADSYAGPFAIFKRQQFPVDDYKTRGGGLRCLHDVTLASDKREALQQLRLCLQEIKSLD